MQFGLFHRIISVSTAGQHFRYKGDIQYVRVCLFSKSPQVQLGSAQIPAGVLDTRGRAGANPHCCLQMNRGT